MADQSAQKLAESRAHLLGLVQDSKVDQLNALLASDSPPSPDFINGAGLTPLMVACSKEGNEEVIMALLNGETVRASIDFTSPETGRTALHIAAFWGNIEAIDVLVAAGASATIKDLEGRLASDMNVHEESSSDSKAVAAAIYSATQARDNPRPASPPEASALSSPESPVDPVEPLGVEERLPSHGVVDPLSKDSATPAADLLLFDAAREGNMSDVLVALDAGSLVDRMDDRGLSALMIAAIEGHSSLVELLVTELGASIDLRSPRSGNNTALQHAVLSGQIDCVLTLLSLGAVVYGLVNTQGLQADEITPREKVTKEEMSDLFATALRQNKSMKRKSSRNASSRKSSPEPLNSGSNALEEMDDDAPRTAISLGLFQPPTEEELAQEAAREREEEEERLKSIKEQQRPASRTDGSGVTAGRDEQQDQGDQTNRTEDSVDDLGTDRSNVPDNVHQAQHQHPESPQQAEEQSPDQQQGGQGKERSFNPTDSTAFQTLPLSQALALVIARYRETCRDFGEPELEFICAAVTNVVYSGQALLLGGASATPGRMTASQRLDDRSLYPLLEVLSYAFANCPLQTVDLSFNHLGRTTAAGLVPFLAATGTLTSLNLEGNDLDRVAGESLAEALLNHPPPSLVKVNLNTNPLGPYALAKWASVIASNSTILDLNLGNTECETLSLMKLATALQSNKTLKRLNLDSPLLFSSQEESTIHLARSIALNHSLTSLSLKGHKMTDSGAAWMAEYLLPNTHITDLNLSRNSLTNTGVAGFVKAIAHRRVECLITLDGNLCKGQGSEEVDEAIAENKGRNQVVFNTRQDRQSLRAKAPL